MSARDRHTSQALLALDHRHIHLWYVAPGQIRRTRLLKGYLELLSEQEQARMQKFSFAADRHNFLVTRALLRTTLSKYVPILPRQWKFSANAYGKPEIVDNEAITGGLYFNLSHCSGLIILAVSRNKHLGVDAEPVSMRQAPLDIAERFFSPSEAAALHSLPAHQRSARFFEYWVTKEAYVKACGKGLSIPLNQFSIYFTPGQHPAISFHSDAAGLAGNWNLWQWCLNETHAVAVCAGHTPQRPLITIKHCIPLVDLASLQDDQHKVGDAFSQLTNPFLAG